jgi:hypothetical protein
VREQRADRDTLRGVELGCERDIDPSPPSGTSPPQLRTWSGAVRAVRTLAR